MSNSTGQKLTERDLLDAMEKVRRQPVPRPDCIITSPKVVERGRVEADNCCAIALWAFAEAERLPWWKFLQRRRLLALFDERASSAESLWTLFGVQE